MKNISKDIFIFRDEIVACKHAPNGGYIRGGKKGEKEKSAIRASRVRLKIFFCSPYTPLVRCSKANEIGVLWVRYLISYPDFTAGFEMWKWEIWLRDYSSFKKNP